MEEKPTHSRGYERRQMSVGLVVVLISVLLLFGLVTHVVSLWIYSRWHVRQDQAASPPRSYVEVAPISREPRLQMSPSRDWQEMRAAEDRVLKSYDWVDREKGIVRLPIDDAMRMVAERGLPARSASTQESAHEK
jgi:hypothetical protein